MSVNTMKARRQGGHAKGAGPRLRLALAGLCCLLAAACATVYRIHSTILDQAEDA